VAPDTQRRFLETAVGSGTTTWVKVVVGATTDPVQFDRAVDMVASVADHRGGDVRQEALPEIFLQPVTPFGTVGEAPTPDQVLELQERALRIYPRVRVVPQTHKAIGQL
jgi:organic radical activating enzyme